jgi:membrane-associated protease RseP (regulator of RpoE activity)
MKGNERAIVAVFTLFIGGAFVAEILSAYQPAKLSILFMLAFWVPLVALHELGHAIAAARLGWRVRQLVVGFGPVIKRFEVRGVSVELRALPIEGFVRCAPTTLDNVRLRSAAIYFAGPGIELVFAGLIWLAVGSGVLFSATQDVSLIALQSLALAAVMGGVLNLIPHSSFSADGEIPNDGLGILLSLSADPREFKAMLEPDEGR